MLRILSEKLRYFYEQQTGKQFNVLFESENKNGMIHGFTENYIKVKAPFDSSLINQLLTVKISDIDNDSCAIIEEMSQIAMV